MRPGESAQHDNSNKIGGDVNKGNVVYRKCYGHFKMTQECLFCFDRETGCRENSKKWW